MKITKNSKNFSFRAAFPSKNLPRIGFFDSGTGGLIVLLDCLRAGLKGEFFYYGDNARAPYGNLPSRVVRRYVFEAFDELAELDADAVVVACNTATALCVDELREKYPFPIVGTEPSIVPAAKAGGTVYVLVTRATFESERFRILCSRTRARFPNCKLIPFSCDGLAGEIEKRLFSQGEKDFSPYFPEIEGEPPDSVVLGCTHYVFLRREIAEFYRCPVYDGNAGVAKRLRAVLSAHPEQPFLTTFSFLPPFSADFSANEDVLRVFSGENSGFGAEEARGTGTKDGFFQKTNERSDFLSKKPPKEELFSEKGDFLSIFFLGSGKKINKNSCKQMFALNSGVIFR